MAVVAGVDYGTLSVRVTLLDSEGGRLSTASAEIPLHRRRDDPDFATQSHADHLTSLAEAMHKVIAASGLDGKSIGALAVDTTGSSVIAVDSQMNPLGDYYLWCDHRAHKEGGRSPT
jgi:L-ribulokinase